RVPRRGGGGGGGGGSPGGGTGRCRHCREVLPSGTRWGPTPGRALFGVASRDESRPILARTAAGEPGAQAAGVRLPPLHRGIRNRRSRRCQSSTRLTSLTDERVS